MVKKTTESASKSPRKFVVKADGKKVATQPKDAKKTNSKKAVTPPQVTKSPRAATKKAPPKKAAPKNTKTTSLSKDTTEAASRNASKATD